MNTTISQSAGDYAIQFGTINHVGAIYILKHDSAAGNRVTLASPENQHLPQPRPLPVRLPPRRFPLLLGRREDVTVAVNTLPYNQPMEFYGSAGIGKTALLRYLAHHPEIAPAFSDGIVYHRLVRHQTVSDLLQVLFNAFYECPTPFKATDMQIRDALKNKKTLVLLDGATLTREEVDGLLNDLPSCTFLFASLERQLWGEGRAVELVGLPLNEAVALVEQELGHPLSAEERSDAEKLCIALEGHPLRILQAVAIAREEKHSLAAIVQRVQSPAATGTWTREILLSLPQPQKIILALFTALGANVALGAEHIKEITELLEVKPAIEALRRRNLIQANDERYNLTSNLIKELQPEKWNSTPWMERTTSFFTKWVQQHCGTPEQLLQERDTILRVLEWAVGAGHWSIVLHLGRTVQGILALSGQWGAWNLVLKWMLLAARAMGDRAAEAFVLHQLGTRALCLNEVADAQSYLTEALRIREALNDEAGIEVTRHNLNFLVEPPPLPDPSPQPLPEPLPEPRPNPLNQKKRLFILGGGVWVLLLALLLLFPKPPDKPPRHGVDNIVSSPGRPDPDSTSSGDESPNLLPSPSTPSTTPSGTVTVEPKPPSPKPSELESLTLNPKDVKLGDSVEGVLKLKSPAPDDGVTILLEADHPLVQERLPSVRFQAGKQEKRFSFLISQDRANNRIAPAVPNTVTVTAVYGASKQSDSVSIILPPVPPSVPELKSLDFLDLKEYKVVQGDSVQDVNATVVLTSSAPSDGARIELVSDNSLAEVPSIVRIQPGKSSSEPFKIKIQPHQQGDNSPKETSVTLTAKYQGVSKDAKLVIVPPPKLTSLVLEPKGLGVDEDVKVTITLSSPAPSSGVTVNLRSSDPSMAPVPSEFIVKGGQTTADFLFKIPSTSPAGDVTITASDDRGVSLSQTLTVVHPG